MNAVVEKTSVGQLVSLFRKIIGDTQSIAYDSAWENGTGYFDNAVLGVKAPRLQQGQVVQSVDPHGRRIGFVGTIAGNCVVFERFKNGQSDVLVSNTPNLIRRLVDLSDGALKKRDIELMFGAGDHLDNIGLRVRKVIGLSEKLRDCADA